MLRCAGVLSWKHRISNDKAMIASRGGAHLAGGPALLLFHGVELEARASVATAVRMHCACLALLIEGIRQRLQQSQRCISKGFCRVCSDK